MRTPALFAALASLASARIIGFAVPSTILPDSNITATITTENYIQSITDVAISFGITPVEYYYAGSLRTYLTTKFLGPELSNILTNITHQVYIPADTAKGDVVLQAAHFQLTGASVGPDIEIYAVNVTVGDVESTELKRSQKTGE